MPEPFGQIEQGVAQSVETKRFNRHLPPTEEEIERRRWEGTVDRIMAEAFVEANVDDPEYINNRELRKRQRKLLMSLPSKFIEELSGHLKAHYVEQSSFPGSNIANVSDKNVLSGEIFERLIEIEDDIFHLDLNWAEHPQTEDQRKIADEILEFMANPERYGFEINSVRNPDLVRIIFKSGVFVIDASVEAKKHLDGRTLKQLRGFRESLGNTAEFINQLENAEAQGLMGLGKNNHQIEISNNYYQIIAVPRSAQLTDEAGISNFIDKNMPAEQRIELIKLINDPTAVRIVRSSFSHAELEILTKYFLTEVEWKLRREDPIT